MTAAFGYLSGLLWLLSSIAWAWSALMRSPVKRNPHGKSNGIELFENVPEDEAISVNGINLPNADRYFAYQRAVAFRNSIAAGLSGAAAIFAFLAVWSATVLG